MKSTLVIISLSILVLGCTNATPFPAPTATSTLPEVILPTPTSTQEPTPVDTPVPTTSGYRWVVLFVSNEVSEGEWFIGLHSDGAPGTLASFDDLQLVPGDAVLWILGTAISRLKKSQDEGCVYKYLDGPEPRRYRSRGIAA